MERSEEMQKNKLKMAVLVDEYGGVSGLATIEDVLEQIVGDIDDELDPEEASSIQPQDGGKYAVAALTPAATNDRAAIKRFSFMPYSEQDRVRSGASIGRPYEHSMT